MKHQPTTGRRKFAFIDNQLLALDFHSGDAVQRGGLHDFFLTPYVGRVIYSNPNTGRVSVQWPWGVESEVPSELVRLNPEFLHILPPSIDQSYSTWERSRYIDDSISLKDDAKWRKSVASEIVQEFEQDTKLIWRRACQLWHSGTNEFDAFKKLSSEFESKFGQEPVKVTVANLYSTGRHIALYWKDKNRTYKMTRREKMTGKMTCPRCATTLKPRTYRQGKKIMQCVGCGFSISPKDIRGIEPEPELELIEES